MFIYLPYVVGECCQLSGIVATLTAAMASRKFIYPNLNETSQDRVVSFLRVLSNLMETAAFLNLGMTCMLHGASNYSLPMIAFAIILCLVSRPIMIYLFSTVLNSFPISHKLNGKTQHMMAFAGLRGVVAFACVNMWPSSDDQKKLFMTTTSLVILFTVFAQGGSTYKMLEYLEIPMGVEEDSVPQEKQSGMMRWFIDAVDRHVYPVTLRASVGEHCASFCHVCCVDNLRSHKELGHSRCGVIVPRACVLRACVRARACVALSSLILAPNTNSGANDGRRRVLRWKLPRHERGSWLRTSVG